MAVTKEVVMIGDKRCICALLFCVEPDLMAGAAYVTTRDDPDTMTTSTPQLGDRDSIATTTSLKRWKS